MNAAKTVRTASAVERERAIDTIVLGFAADPFCRWLWPEPAQYLAAMARLVPIFGGKAFDEGTAYATEGFEATALWLPRGVEPDEEAMQALTLETANPEILEDVGALFEAMEEFHPEGEIWYLPLIACDPLHIGNGYGGALMRHALERVDESGLPAYLESSNPRNISLYLRHGFEIVGEIQHGSSPVMTPMLRPARAGD
ncbi:MAG: GNAT family N-acetyltransferase [Parasphingopyxis sp.]